MFALRDFGAASKEAVLALAEGFGDGSALFRYVPSYPSSPPSLLYVIIFSYIILEYIFPSPRSLATSSFGMVLMIDTK
jgi:hypothetical protein